MKNFMMVYLVIGLLIIPLQGMEKKVFDVPLHPQLQAVANWIKRGGRHQQRPIIHLVGPTKTTLKNQACLFERENFEGYEAQIKDDIRNNRITTSTDLVTKITANRIEAFLFGESFSTNEFFVRWRMIEGYTKKTVGDLPDPFVEETFEGNRIAYRPILLICGLIQHNVLHASKKIIDLVSDKKLREHDNVIRETVVFINKETPHLPQVPFSQGLKQKILKLYNEQTVRDTPSMRLRIATRKALKIQRAKMAP